MQELGHDRGARPTDGLTERQLAAVTTSASRLCIIAGAGSGKTRVLTRRIAVQAAEGTVDPTRTLAVTFTRKAADELRLRLRRLGGCDGVDAGTFHALAYAQLRARWADRGIRPPTLLERPGRIVHRLLPGSVSPRARAGTLAEITWAAACRLAPGDYAEAARRAGRAPDLPLDQIATVIESYRTEKNRRRVVDFDDMLELAIRDLADPEYAEARRWRFRHLFVDEFQDVNPLQFDLLRAWLDPLSTLCVVGDPNQAIYGWNGADPSYLAEFARWFPDAEIIELRENFRSTPEVLAAASGLLARGAGLVPTLPSGPRPTILRHPDERTEARRVARAVRDGHGPGRRWREQAILVRTNAQTAVLAEALRAAGIPAAVRAGAGLLDAPGVPALLGELADLDLPVATVATDLRTEAAAAEHDDESETLTALAQLAEEHLRLVPQAGSAELVTWLRATVQDAARDRSRDAVEITTFHAAKGLEWPVVHLAGLEDGFVPHHRVTTAAAADEERRLLYVAATRAETELHITWSETRQFGTKVVTRRPSPLLRPMFEGLDLLDPAAESGTDPAAMVRSTRAQLASALADPVSDPLLDALQRWRAEAARAADAPPAAVMSDRALAAVAQRRPSSVDDLAAIGDLGPIRAARYGSQLLSIVGANT